MKKIGAPEYTEEELEFAREIGGTIPRQAKVNLLRRYRIPDWENYLEEDVLMEILDPMFEGESSAGSTDVGDVSWKAPSSARQPGCWAPLPTHGKPWRRAPRAWATSPSSSPPRR